jgi:hypothetical protein
LLYESMVALAREIDDHETIAIGLLNLAMVSICQGESARARERLFEAIRIVESTGSRHVGQSVLEVSAGLAVLEEEWYSAARFVGAAESQASRTGLHRDPADEAFLAPRIERTKGQLNAGEFAAGLAEGLAIAQEVAVAQARQWLEAMALNR